VTDSTPDRDRHLPVGSGELPIAGTLRRLKVKGYRRKVIFEGLALGDTLESVRVLREMVG
jgi:sugar phosphate isomerase/epimerase